MQDRLVIKVSHGAANELENIRSLQFQSALVHYGNSLGVLNVCNPLTFAMPFQFRCLRATRNTLAENMLLGVEELRHEATEFIACRNYTHQLSLICFT